MPKSTPVPLMASRLNLVGKVLEALRKMDQQSSPLLLIFWGSRGSGKTTFLEETRNRLSSEPDVEVAGYWDMMEAQTKNIPKKILKAVDAKKTRLKTVIFDNMDVLLKDESGRTFFDFESKAILPLIERGDTLIIIGSQVELNLWQEYDVRLRLENHHIGPLSLEEIKEMVIGEKINAETVYELTFGQPKAIEKYITHTKWSGEDVARFATAYFLEELPKETRETAQMVSLFPAFNVYILRKVQGNANTDDDGLLAQYMDQINELTRRWIVRFDTDSGAYRFTDQAIRRLLALHVAASRPGQFTEIQQIAAEYFQEEAQNATYLPQLIVSAIYHQAQASRAKSQGKRGVHCVKWVESMRDYWNGANWKQVIEQWQSGDKNPELKNEITSLIGAGNFQRISALFLQYKLEMEA